MRVTRKKVAIGGAVLGAIALAGSIAFGPVVRSRISNEAARRGLEVGVGSVRPGWFAVRLVDVNVRLAAVDCVDATLGEVRVELTGGLSVDRVHVRGGELRLRGDVEELRRELTAWRARVGEPSSPSTGGGQTPISGDAIAVRWTVSANRELDATGMSFARDGKGFSAAVDLAHLRDADIALTIGGGSVELDSAHALRSTHAASLEIAWSAPATPVTRAEGAPSAAGVAASASSAPSPPPPVVLVKGTHAAKRGDPSRPMASAALAEGRGPFVELPNLRAWRALAGATAVRIADRIPDAVTVSIDALSAKLVRDGTSIAVGPGPFTIARRAGRVDFQFSSSGGAGGTPLSLHATMPVAEGDVSLTLEGGPVALSVLGVRDGAGGLTDVERATLAGKGRLVLADDALTFDGELRVRGAAIKQPRLASDVIRGLDLGIAARGVLSDKGELRLDDFSATMGALHVSVSGLLRQSDELFAATLRFDIPSASCQALLESVPTALLPNLRGAKYTGTFGARGNLSVDSRSIDDLVLAYDIQDQCRVSEASPALARERFKQPFTHRIYLPDGSLGEETTGPGTGKWVSFGGISPFMIVAVLTTEDGGFYRHHGFSHPAIKSSVIANLKARRFVRGASTITMQLAKNLFLLREKTLSRKLEEVILTAYLEQAFTKDELMEMYLNIIEYGPNVYGIGPAAFHYFGRSPTEINLAESLFLSSMLPAPLRYHHLKSGGQLSEGWQRTLVHLMTIAKKSGLISEEELEEGKDETVVFYKTGPRGPARRHSHLDAPSTDEVVELQESN